MTTAKAEAKTSATKSYFRSRVDAIGFDAKIHTGTYPTHNDPMVSKDAKKPLMWEDEKGNIVIPYRQLNGQFRYFDKSTSSSRFHLEFITKTRVKNPSNPDNKYFMTKGKGVFPYPSDRVVKAFLSESKIKTLVIIEGEIKAMAGDWLLDLYTISIPGIQNWTEKDKKEIFWEIGKIVKDCKVEEIIWMQDGDCLKVTYKEGKDLYKRPHDFYNSLYKFKTYCKDFNLDLYFMHIDPECEYKGLDDLAIAYPKKRKQIQKEILKISGDREFFVKLDVSTMTAYQMRKYFYIDDRLDATRFWQQYEEVIRDRPFIYARNEWQFDEDTGKVVRIRSEEASNYIQVLDKYFVKTIRGTINRKGQGDETFNGTIEHQLETIKQIGIKGKLGHKQSLFKRVLNEIPYYEGFINVPGHHEDFKQTFEFFDEATGIKSKLYNTYKMVTHVPTEGEFPHIESLIKHIFGEKDVTHNGKKFKSYELGYDYYKLLWQRPKQELPIVVLVSEKRATGKTTLCNLTRAIFQQNVRKVRSKSLGSQFNSSYATSLVVCLEELKVDKMEIVEQLKEMVTAEKGDLEFKGVDSKEVDNFIKIMITSNNLHNFMPIHKDEVRFWVLEVDTLKQQIFDFADKIRSEIPAFLHFLQERKLVTKNESRGWFNNSLIMTEALKRVQNHSKSGKDQVIESAIREMFALCYKGVLQYGKKDLSEIIGSNELKMKDITSVMNRWKLPKSKYSQQYTHYRYEENGDKTIGTQKRTEFYTFHACDYFNKLEYLDFLSLEELSDMEVSLIKFGRKSWMHGMKLSDIEHKDLFRKHIVDLNETQIELINKMMADGESFENVYTAMNKMSTAL